MLRSFFFKLFYTGRTQFQNSFHTESTVCLYVYKFNFFKGGSHDVMVSVNLFDYYIQLQVRDNYKVLMHNKFNKSPYIPISKQT